MCARKLKVLVVDDQVGVLFMLETIVKEMGHNAYLAKNGVEAVSVAKSVAPDLVLMDVRMPLMNGLDAMVEMKANNSKVQVVLMSACSMGDTVEEALGKGALACISKPFDIEYIRELLHNFSGADKNSIAGIADIDDAV